MGKVTTEEWIEKAREVHRDKYDYTKSVYTTAKDKIKVICPLHGEFLVRASHHTHSGSGCTECASLKKKQLFSDTKTSFIEKANKHFNNIFDYSNVVYDNARTPVKIICKKHGEFEQTPSVHLSSKFGCSLCANFALSENYRKSHEDFIAQAISVHNNKYDYSNTVYKSSKDKVEIICQKHGSFYQIASNHINNGYGCQKCAHDYVVSLRRGTTETFIEKALEVHGDVFDYSRVKYKTGHDNITILCKIHGEFEQTPNNHLSSKLCCPVCVDEYLSEKYALGVEEFVTRARTIHNDRYKYDKVVYKNALTPVTIICGIHGDFEQQPSVHINQGCGCPKCGHVSSKVCQTLSKEDFIKRSIDLFGDKYDYSLLDYKGISEPVKLKCKVHNREFTQYPSNHFKGHEGCKYCTKNHFYSIHSAEVHKQEFMLMPSGVYILRITDKTEVFLKIGISKQVDIRITNITNELTGSTVELLSYEKVNLYDAILLENKMHELFKEFCYEPTNKFAGYTECFDVKIENECIGVLKTNVRD